MTPLVRMICLGVLAAVTVLMLVLGLVQTFSLMAVSAAAGYWYGRQSRRPRPVVPVNPSRRQRVAARLAAHIGGDE
jgi:hypothetical protein